MLAIVMEPQVKLGKWSGPVGMTLGKTLFIDLSFDFADTDRFRKGMDELLARIQTPLQE